MSNTDTGSKEATMAKLSQMIERAPDEKRSEIETFLEGYIAGVEFIMSKDKQ